MANTVEISRLRPLSVVVAVIVATFAVADVGLRLCLDMVPRSLENADYLQPKLLDWTGGRVAGVADQRRVDHAPPPLGIIVGFSTAFAGLVPEILEHGDSAHRRWLNLGSRGGSYPELAYYLRPLTWSDLAPDLIVLGVHPGMMAGRINIDDFDESPFKTMLRRTSWLGSNRNRFNITLQRWFRELRADLFLGIGLPLDAVFAPPADPWLEERLWNGHSDAHWRELQWRGWTRLGWFDPGHYDHVNPEIEAARDVVRTCEAKAKRVVIVLMPETRVLRDHVPPEAEAAFRRALVGLPYEPPIIDLRDVAPDGVFYDYAHPNEDGRPIISAQFVMRLRELELSPAWRVGQ